MNSRCFVLRPAHFGESFCLNALRRTFLRLRVLSLRVPPIAPPFVDHRISQNNPNTNAREQIQRYRQFLFELFFDLIMRN